MKLTPDTRVIPARVQREVDSDVQAGVVLDHLAAEMTPPADGLVLVRWSRSTMAWEDPADLVVAPQ